MLRTLALQGPRALVPSWQLPLRSCTLQDILPSLSHLREGIRRPSALAWPRFFKFSILLDLEILLRLVTHEGLLTGLALVGTRDLALSPELAFKSCILAKMRHWSQ